MTRTLYLMRHAQAVSGSWKGDAERDLSEHGRKQARQAGTMLAHAGIQMALVSSAARTRQTFAELHLPKVNGEPVHAEFMDALYDAGTPTILQRISEIPDEITTALVLAHAPGIPGLASEFTWASSHNDSDMLGCGFGTATIASFTLDVPWSQLADFDAFHFTEPGAPESPVRPLDKPFAPSV